MVLLRIFDSADTCFTTVLKRATAFEARAEWRTWLADTITADENATLLVCAYGDNYSRSPIEVIVKMSRITAMTITDMRPEVVT